MHAHTKVTTPERQSEQERVKEEISGSLPRLPFVGMQDALSGKMEIITNADSPADYFLRRLKASVERDMRFAASGSVWHRSRGLGMVAREVYGGSKQLVDGGN